jgi:molecular chaperone HscB
LDEYRATGHSSEAEPTLRAKLQSERAILEQRQRDMETQLQQLFAQWDTLQDRGEATEQARAERDRILKQMREILSNRTYVRNIVNDLVATIA